jgi:hypothetical protein
MERRIVTRFLKSYKFKDHTMNSITFANEFANETDVAAQNVRDLVDVEVVMIGGGEIASNGY